MARPVLRRLGNDIEYTVQTVSMLDHGAGLRTCLKRPLRRSALAGGLPAIPVISGVVEFFQLDRKLKHMTPQLRHKRINL
jgi:hypothetical protein